MAAKNVSWINMDELRREISRQEALELKQRLALSQTRASLRNLRSFLVEDTEKTS